MKVKARIFQNDTEKRWTESAEEVARAAIGWMWNQQDWIELDMPQLVHVERHNPARVLAECEAKRRIVEDYFVLDADYRATRNEVTEARRFQALALPYADHPDYDEAWRP